MLATNKMDKSAPMPSAPMLYKADGSVDWGNMWESFCILAQEGGPPHRGTLLRAQINPDTSSATYQFAVREIIRGIREVSGLEARAAAPGWICVACASPEMALWLSEAIITENVEARAEETDLLVPVGDYFSLQGEIKNVITAVAKTAHYWKEHLAHEVKQVLWFQNRLNRLSQRVKTWLGHRIL